NSLRWERRLAAVRAGFYCRGLPAIASSSINGRQITATRSPVVRQSWRSTCTSIPITSTSARRRQLTSTLLCPSSVGKIPIVFLANVRGGNWHKGNGPMRGDYDAWFDMVLGSSRRRVCFDFGKRAGSRLAENRSRPWSKARGVWRCTSLWFSAHRSFDRPRWCDYKTRAGAWRMGGIQACARRRDDDGRSCFARERNYPRHDGSDRE